MNKDALDMWKAFHFHNIAPPTQCEICQKTLPTHANAINLMFTATVGVPGHPSLSSFSCPHSLHQNTEHWTCSPECWEKAAIQCIQNDMLPIIREGLERIHGDTGHTKDGIQ